MRKTVAICLCALLLMNAMGYYGLLIGLRYKTSADLTARIDSDNYKEEETISLKVPLTIPYYMDDSEFERVDGQIEHDGQIYRLIKQKLAKDTLVIVCIKDRESGKIKRALNDYVRTFTDQPVQSKSTGKIVFSFIKDFIASEVIVKSSHAGWHHPVEFSSYSTEHSTSLSPTVTTPPPRA